MPTPARAGFPRARLLCRTPPKEYATHARSGLAHFGMGRERRQRWLARIALALLALVAELAGRSLAHRLDVGRHVGRVSYAHADYYPFLLAAVKVGVALMLARLVWRFAKARRVASLIGGSPRVRVELSARLWLASFAATSVIYLVQMDAEGAGPTAPRAVAPLVRAAGVRRSVRPRRAPLPQRRAVAPRLRASSPPTRPRACAGSGPSAFRSSISTSLPRRGSASASRSSRGRLRSPPDGVVRARERRKE